MFGSVGQLGEERRRRPSPGEHGECLGEAYRERGRRRKAGADGAQERYEEAEATQRQLELDANSRPIQNRPTTSQTYLIATIGLAGSLVSAGLAITEIAEYAHHDRVGNLTILGMVIGALAGLTAAVANDKKPSGWAYRINIVAAWLAGISFSCLLLFFLGQHGWMPEGG